MICFICINKLDEQGKPWYSYHYIEAHNESEAKRKSLEKHGHTGELIHVARDAVDLTGMEQMFRFLEEEQIASSYA